MARSFSTSRDWQPARTTRQTRHAASRGVIRELYTATQDQTPRPTMSSRVPDVPQYSRTSTFLRTSSSVILPARYAERSLPFTLNVTVLKSVVSLGTSGSRGRLSRAATVSHSPAPIDSGLLYSIIASTRADFT